LALHEEYGEENNPKAKLMIFNKLAAIDEEIYYKNKNKAENKDHRTFSNTIKKRIAGEKRREYGPNVGKDGGNP
jgi:hypothetical protein